jgi:hypothetical protein
MWDSQSWLRRTFPGPALAGLRAGCRQDCLPHALVWGYSQDSKMPMSRYRVYSADYRNSAAPEGEPQEG